MMSLINSYAGNLDVVVERLMKFAVGIHSIVDWLRGIQGEVIRRNDI